MPVAQSARCQAIGVRQIHHDGVFRGAMFFSKMQVELLAPIDFAKRKG